MFRKIFLRVHHKRFPVNFAKKFKNFLIKLFLKKKKSEAATSFLQKKLFLKTSPYSQENTGVGVSF